MKKSYPVGATWQAINKDGYKVTIWLDEIRDTMEIWKWSFTYSDGSGPSSWQGGDWNTSYQGCVNASSYKLWIKGEKQPRFKRIK